MSIRVNMSRCNFFRNPRLLWKRYISRSMLPQRSNIDAGSDIWEDGARDLLDGRFGIHGMFSVGISKHISLFFFIKIVYRLGNIKQRIHKRFVCSDVLSYMDKHCSGRISCDVPVMFLLVLTNPCTDDMRSYLQASYTCIPGEWAWILGLSTLY